MNQVQPTSKQATTWFPRTFRYFRCSWKHRNISKNLDSKASSCRGELIPLRVHVQFWPRFYRGFQGVLILVRQRVAFIMTRASHSVRDVFTGLHVVQQVADFCWDVLDWMSGGMECHCCCEEQLLALGSATAASLTTMIRDGHSVVKKDCNCLYYISTKKHGNIWKIHHPTGN